MAIERGMNKLSGDANVTKQYFWPFLGVRGVVGIVASQRNRRIQEVFISKK